MSIGRRLRELRTEAGLTAVELGGLAGKSKSHVGMIENGEREGASLQTVGAIARVLGVSLDWLYDETGRRPSVRHLRLAVNNARVAQRRAS